MVDLFPTLVSGKLMLSSLMYTFFLWGLTLLEGGTRAAAPAEPVDWNTDEAV